MRWAWVLLLALLIGLVGCGDRKAALVGKWQLSVEGGSSPADEALRGMAKAMLNSFELELMKSGQATAKVMGREQTGKWSLEGDVITIDVLGSPIRGKVDPSNKTIRVDEFQGAGKATEGMTLTLQKKDAP